MQQKPFGALRARHKVQKQGHKDRNAFSAEAQRNRKDAEKQKAFLENPFASAVLSFPLSFPFVPCAQRPVFVPFPSDPNKFQIGDLVPQPQPAILEAGQWPVFRARHE